MGFLHATVGPLSSSRIFFLNHARSHCVSLNFKLVLLLEYAVQATRLRFAVNRLGFGDVSSMPNGLAPSLALYYAHSLKAQRWCHRIASQWHLGYKAKCLASGLYFTMCIWLSQCSIGQIFPLSASSIQLPSPFYSLYRQNI